MTLQDLIDWLATNSYYVLYYFAAILVLALIISAMVNRKSIDQLKYAMSTLVYAVTVPGVLALLLVLYHFLISRSSLLEVSILSYFLPIVAMVLTLWILNRKVKMAKLPGFTRLSSLIVMIFIAFFILFVLQRTYFGVLILGGFTQVLVVFAVILLVLKVAWTRFAR